MADQFVAQLLAEKKQLEAAIAEKAKQLDAIDELLRARGHTPVGATVHGPGHTPVITKAEAIKRVLQKAKGPLKPRQLVPLMKAEGYTFSGKNPLNALNNLLYGRKKLPFVARVKGGLALKK